MCTAPANPMPQLPHRPLETRTIPSAAVSNGPPAPKWQVAPPAPQMRTGPTNRPTCPLHAPERSHTELVRSPTAAPPRKTTRRRLTARRPHGVTGRRPVTPLKKSHTCFAHAPAAPIAPHRPADLMGHLPRAQTGSTSPNCDRDTPRPVPRWQLAPPAPRMRAGATDRPTRPLHAPERSHTELVRSPTASPPRKATRHRL